MASPYYYYGSVKYYAQTGTYSTKQSQDYVLSPLTSQTIAFGATGIDQLDSPPVTFELNGNMKFVDAGVYAIDISVNIEPDGPNSIDAIVGIQRVRDALWLTQESYVKPTSTDITIGDEWAHLHACDYFQNGDEIGLIVVNNDSANDLLVPSDRPAYCLITRIS